MTDGTRRRLAWTLSLLVAAPCLIAPRGAAAIDAELRSRQLYKQGETLANDGNWVEACPLFQAAHDLHGTGGTALRTADCYEKVGKYDRALALYQYIVDHRDTDKSERVALAEGRVAALKKQLGVDQPVAPPVVVTVTPPPPPPPPPLPPPSKAPAFVAFGAGGVGLVLGATFGALALKQASDLKSECTAGVSCPQWSTTRNAAETKAWVSNAGIAVAVAGAVVGFVLLKTGASPSAKAAVRSAVGPGGLTLRF
jgi:hypothetical protein